MGAGLREVNSRDLHRMRWLVFLLSWGLILCTGFYARAEVLNLQEGLALFEQKQYQKAQFVFQSLFKQHPENPEIAFQLGRSALASGDYLRAVEVLEKAVEMDNGQGGYFFVLGLAYARTLPEAGMLKRVGVAKKMQRAMASAVRLDPKNSDARISLISFYLSAPGFAGGSLEEAKKHLAILKDQFPDRTFMIEGSVFEKEERVAEAEAVYRKGMKESRSPGNVFNLAGYLMRQKQFDEAISLFNEYLAMDSSWLEPKKAGAYFMLGLIYQEKKMQKEAETAFRAALVLHPDPWMEKEINKRL